MEKICARDARAAPRREGETRLGGDSKGRKGISLPLSIPFFSQQVVRGVAGGGLEPP